jgi:single-strand DNA-binding protein
MIKLQVIGNLGKDCVVNNVNGKNVINFSIAHTERFKDSSGAQKDRTVWVECAYWTDRTGIAPYLKKGTQIYAEGTPDIRTYQTQDGRQGASLSLRVQNVQLLGSKQGGEQSHENTDTASSYRYNNNYNTTPVTPSTSDINEPLDDLPF